MSSNLPPLPSFIIIGAQKSATRWLRSNLAKHPDVFAPDFEVTFFNNGRQYHQGGPDWYRSQFSGWEGQSIVGEATPGYMMWRHRPGVVARRIQATIPDVRVMAILRNPIDRAVSGMLHHQRRGRLPKKKRLVDLVHRTDPESDPLGLVAGGWYSASLRPYVRRFGPQLRVVLYEDVGDDPRAVYREALAHVGARPDFAPDDLGEVVFSNRRPSTPDDLVTEEERLELWSYFEDDVRRLERLIGRDLSCWAPVRPKRSVWSRLSPPRLEEILPPITGSLERLIGGVAPEQWELPTPSGDDVRELVDLVIELARFTATAVRREQIAWAETDDPAKAFAEAAAIVVAAADDREFLNRLHGFGESVIEGRAILVTHASQLLLHSWDLAVGTDQDLEVPVPVIAECERFVQAVTRTERDPTLPSLDSIVIDEGWPEIERFVALYGRDPLHVPL
jgi:uncharacterized protein (TIGR03086 family)